MTRTNFKLGKVNPTLPVELDDGTPVTIVRTAAAPNGRCFADVRLPDGVSYMRRGRAIGGIWSYYLDTGEWAGGSPADYKVLRNRTAAAGADKPGANPKARHGAAKPNLALIPAGAQLQIAPVFALGAKKYGPYNWRKDAVEAETYVAAAQRHLFSWFDGEDVDPESGELHLAHASACLMILLDAAACGKLIDNRPHAGAAAELIRKKTKPVD